jgi:hypothetical protein
MATKRVLARVGVKAKDGELVYYKDGVLYAVKAKRGGTKGAKKKKCATKKKAAPKKKKAAPKRKAATKKKAAPKRRVAKKKSSKQGRLFR